MGGSEADLPSELAIKVFSAFTMAGMRIVRVGNADLACERMVTTMPQIVVVMRPLDAASRARLGDHAQAVGATLIDLEETREPAQLDALLLRAVETANAKTSHGERPLVDEGEPPTGEPDDSELAVDIHEMVTAPPPAAGHGKVTAPPPFGNHLTDTAPPPPAGPDEIDEGW